MAPSAERFWIADGAITENGFHVTLKGDLFHEGGPWDWGGPWGSSQVPGKVWGGERGPETMPNQKPHMTTTKALFRQGREPYLAARSHIE